MLINSNKDAVIFALCFATCFAYLYSLQMPNMTLRQVVFKIKSVWHSDIRANTNMEEMMDILCHSLIGWMYDCANVGRPSTWKSINYTFKIWLACMVIYLFLIVWFVLEWFEWRGRNKALALFCQERIQQLKQERIEENMLEFELIQVSKKERRFQASVQTKFQTPRTKDRAVDTTCPCVCSDSRKNMVKKWVSDPGIDAILNVNVFQTPKLATSSQMTSITI